MKTYVFCFDIATGSAPLADIRRLAPEETKTWSN